MPLQDVQESALMAYAYTRRTSAVTCIPTKLVLIFLSCAHATSTTTDVPAQMHVLAEANANKQADAHGNWHENVNENVNV